MKATLMDRRGFDRLLGKNSPEWIENEIARLKGKLESISVFVCN